MATVNDWVAGARPRTLWTAVSPVAVGTAAAYAVGGFAFLPALLALGTGIAMQVAVNYANDYSDGVRGTDADRIGPDRLVATGKATPSAVKTAAFLSFGAAALLGAGLVFESGVWWLAVVGLMAIAAAWTYTGSANPYGYAGWGEVSVFVFFGPVATLGTMYTQAGQVTWWAVAGSVGVGLYAVALLLVNNIRDLETDALAGKRTLAVRVGSFQARRLFAAAVNLPVGIAILIAFAHPWALLATLVALPSLLMSFAMRSNAPGEQMPLLFIGVSAVGLTYGLMLAMGLAI
jgi:1,4-dihydroxy-2-naphthoate octaprenyltransferase